MRRILRLQIVSSSSGTCPGVPAVPYAALEDLQEVQEARHVLSLDEGDLCALPKFLTEPYEAD
jgi:hypothetical protein